MYHRKTKKKPEKLLTVDDISKKSNYASLLRRFGEYINTMPL